MKRTLLDVIFASEKRKNVLLFLQDGAKKTDTLLCLLETSRQSLLPQMKILEEHYLVTHYEDTYELTTIGQLVVDDMVPLLNEVGVLDIDIDYWGTRNLDFIPPYLLDKMGELKGCEIINPSITELFSVHKSLNPGFKVSPVVYTVTTIIYPDFDSIFTEMLDSGVDVHYIVSQELLDKIKIEYRDEFGNFLKNRSFNMHVYNKDMQFLYFTFDNVHTLICMLTEDGEFDHKFLICKSKSAVDWTKELFDYHLQDSTPITQI